MQTEIQQQSNSEKTFRHTIGKIQLAENNQSEKERIFGNFRDLFENNETIKDTEIKIQLKPGHYPIKKTGPVPLHLQENVGKELKILIRTRHLEKINDVDEDCFGIAGSIHNKKR